MPDVAEHRSRLLQPKLQDALAECPAGLLQKLLDVTGGQSELLRRWVSDVTLSAVWPNELS